MTNPNIWDTAFGVPGLDSGILSPDAMKRARRQGLLHAGIAMLASNRDQSLGQGLQNALQAGQQGYQGQVQGAMQAQEYQKQQQGQQAMAGFAARVQAAGNDPDALMKIARDAIAMGAQHGIPTLSQGGLSLAQQITASNARQDTPANWQRGTGTNPSTGKPEQYAFNPQTQEIKWLGIAPEEKPNQGNVMTSEDAIRFENNEYDRYTRQTKNIQTRAQSYETITGAAQGAKAMNASSQIAMVFAFMKMLDPTSVVRESEYATAANAAGVPERIRNLWNKLQEGVFLTPTQIDNMLAEAREQAGRSKTEQDKTIEQYRRKAKRRGLNPDAVTFDWWEGIDLTPPKKQEEF